MPFLNVAAGLLLLGVVLSIGPSRASAQAATATPNPPAASAPGPAPVAAPNPAATTTPRPAAAPTGKPSVQAVSTFVAATRLGYLACAEKYRAYLERWELYALMTEGQREPQGTAPSDVEVADCVHQTGLKGMTLYKSAVKTAATPKERTAYGEYMTAWDAALKDLRKMPQESVKAYRARQRQVEERLDRLQSRLEASVDLQG